MTPQEQQMIDGLISRIRNTPVQDKDAQAEQHIQQALSNNPDALYVLVQTVLVQQYGLEQAQSQMNELKQQVQALQSHADQGQKSSGGSFLSHIFGGGHSDQASQQQGSSQPQYQPVNNPGPGSQAYPGGYPAPPPPPPSAYPQQGYPAPGGGGMLGGGGMMGGGGGFLRGALQTAAGVAAGEAVFQGMEDLFHGFGGHGGGYGLGGGGGETVINNTYYDDDRGQGDQGFYNPDNDASRNDVGAVDDGASDVGSFGGNDFSDTSSDDSSGFDGGNDFSDNS